MEARIRQTIPSLAVHLGTCACLDVVNSTYLYFL